MGTYTFVIMQVSEETFKEIEQKMKAAGYDHVFHNTDKHGVVIDMHGIGIQSAGDLSIPLNEHAKGSIPFAASVVGPASKELIDALKWFCTRVDNGELRSRKTYGKFKALILKYEQQRRTEEIPVMEIGEPGGVVDYLSVLAPSNGEVKEGADFALKNLNVNGSHYPTFNAAVDWLLQWQRDYINWQDIRKENGAQRATRLADERETITQILEKAYPGQPVMNEVVHAIQKARK